MNPATNVAAQDFIDEHFRQNAIACWRRDIAEWFPNEQDSTVVPEALKQVYSKREVRAIPDSLAGSSMVPDNSGYPGTGYFYADHQERAEVQQQLANAQIDWNKPTTRRILNVGPKDELMPEHDGLLRSEFAACFPGQAVELGGEFDEEQTIVVARRWDTPVPSESLAEEEDVDQEEQEEDEDDSMAVIEMEDVSDGGDDDDNDPDYEDIAVAGKKDRMR